MRKLLLVIVVLLVAGLAVGLYPARVDRPIVGGVGPMAVVVSAQYTAPEYHSPLDYYRVHHMDLLNRGDLAQADCLHCHEPEHSCDSCHRYVGVKLISNQ